ncbi:MAG TPA: cation diffusion facilitator family transporter, partial [Arachidicoccus sp.]
FFLRDKDSDMNIKSAYLHLMSDALVSVALVIGGIIIHFTHWFWMDSALSILVAVVIIIATWQLLKDSLRLSLDGVPENINIDEIKDAAMKINGVKDFHHIHVWALSTTENALTAHLVVARNISNEEQQQIKHKLKHTLEHQNIQHITIETEMENNPCQAHDCGDESIL